MEKWGWLYRMGRALRRIAVIEVAIVAVALVFSLLVGWRTTNEISLVVTIVGVLVFAIGPFSLIGGWGTTRTWNYQYVRTMEDNTAAHRRRQDAQEVARDAGLVFPSIVLGVLTMFVGAMIQTLF
ncbi:MAG TPA: hypothetical protein PKD09_21665 [Aggregatilinea sp.]|jgi:hypothetical protein|uniref:hypothetical protein n=1 Tax=Aggregatilinea sp. TaxID=2806333 RepID=UPI002B99233A|nr:hypothetical protein [Aggregatilinea sp.]HML24278.1 hypothetical protein [Aggregatilinea sp.]